MKKINLYNLELLHQMKNNERMAEVLQLFLETTPILLEEIRKNVLYENWDQVYKKSHNLKSSLGILQMKKLLEDISLIESLSFQKTGLHEIPHLVKSLIAQYELITPMLQADLHKVKEVSLLTPKYHL